MPPPTCPALTFNGVLEGVNLVGTVEFGKAQAGRTLTLEDIHLTFIDLVAVDVTTSEPPWLISVAVQTVQKIDPEDSVLKSYLEGTFTIPIADVTLAATYHGTYTYSDGQQTSTAQDFCIYMSNFDSGDTQAVFVDASGNIWAGPIATFDTKVIIRATDGHGITGVGFHRSLNKIYFLTLDVSGNFIIRRMNTDGSNEELVADTGQDDPGGSPMNPDSGALIVLESEGLLIFATDNSIYKADIDGTNVVLITTGAAVLKFFFPGPGLKFYRNAFTNPAIQQFDANVLTGPEASSNATERHGVYVPEHDGGKVIIVKNDLSVHKYDSNLGNPTSLGFSTAINPNIDIGYRQGENAFYYRNSTTKKLVKMDLSTGTETNASDWTSDAPHERGGPIFVR